MNANYSNYMGFLQYSLGASNDTLNQVQEFYFPSDDPANRGIPQYGGSNFNAYSGINPYGYSTNPEDMGGDQLYADLIRAQTQDYLTRYAPVENFLASEITATGTKSLAGDMQRTRQGIMGASRNVQGQQNRAMERFGLSGEQFNSNNMSTASTLVGGLNATRAADVDRRTQLLGGSLSGIAQRAAAQGQGA